MAGIGRLASVQVDTADPVASAKFWSAVLGVEQDEPLGDPAVYLYLRGPGGSSDQPTVAFQRVPEKKTVKNRVHFDVAVDDVEEATSRIEELGGRRVPGDDFDEYGFRWRAMADPDDNEFCLIYDAQQ